MKVFGNLRELAARRAGGAKTAILYLRCLGVMADTHNFLTIIYDRIMAKDAFFDDEFKAGIVAAGARARLETLAAGVSVFYRDGVRNIDIIEEPSGRKFEIRYVSNGVSDWNYEIVSELHEPTA